MPAALVASLLTVCACPVGADTVSSAGQPFCVSRAELQEFVLAGLKGDVVWMKALRSCFNLKAGTKVAVIEEEPGNQAVHVDRVRVIFPDGDSFVGYTLSIGLKESGSVRGTVFKPSSPPLPCDAVAQTLIEREHVTEVRSGSAGEGGLGVASMKHPDADYVSLGYCAGKVGHSLIMSWKRPSLPPAFGAAGARIAAIFMGIPAGAIAPVISSCFKNMAKDKGGWADGAFAGGSLSCAKRETGDGGVDLTITQDGNPYEAAKAGK